MFCLTTHSTHFIYYHIVSAIWQNTSQITRCHYFMGMGSFIVCTITREIVVILLLFFCFLFVFVFVLHKLYSTGLERKTVKCPHRGIDPMTHRTTRFLSNVI